MWKPLKSGKQTFSEEPSKHSLFENGVPEKSVIEADEPYMVYGEMNPDIDDGISMRLQLINPDIDVEIPLYKEECHALSGKNCNSGQS